MERLKKQILEFLEEDKKVLHKIYAKWIDDHAYLWTEFEDLDKLRHILLVIIKLFYEEHKQLHDVNAVDYKEFRREFRELIANPDALLQKAQKAQIKEIEKLGPERWFDIFKIYIEEINGIIERYDSGTASQDKHKSNADTLEEEFWRNYASLPVLARELAEHAHTIAQRMFEGDRNFLGRIKRRLRLGKVLAWEEYVKLGNQQAFKEKKEYYLRKYVEGKIQEAERRRELFKTFSKIVFPGNMPSLRLSYVEKLLYEENGNPRPKFKEFYAKILNGIIDGTILLRYFPMLETDPPNGKDIQTQEQFDNYRYNRDGNDNRNSTTCFDLKKLKDGNMGFVRIDSGEEDNHTFGGQHTELTRTTDITEDMGHLGNRNFSVQLTEKYAILYCDFPMKDDRRGNRIQLRILYNLTYPKSRQVAEDLKDHPWYMVGVLKESSKAFSIDIYFFIKDSYCLYSNVDASELRKRYNESPKKLEFTI